MCNLGTSAVAKLTHKVNHHDVVGSIDERGEVALGRQSQWGVWQEAELGTWECSLGVQRRGLHGRTIAEVLGELRQVHGFQGVRAFQEKGEQ